MKRILITLMPLALLLLQSCSPYSVTKATIYNQYPAQPTSQAETVISFMLSVKGETTVLPTITLEGSNQSFVIKEVYTSTNQLLSLDKPLQEGTYRIVAKSNTIQPSSEEVSYILTLNGKKYSYNAARVPDVRMK